jgi:hypothetical protein
VFKPGQSGNPHGRPRKGKTLTDILEKELRRKQVKVRDSDGDILITGKEAAARKLLQLALSGDVGALKYIFDRIDGKPDIFQHVIDENEIPLVVFDMGEDGKD